MRWFRAAFVVLSVMATTGCPSEFGKGGRIDKAVAKDSKGQAMEIMKCSDKRKAEVCAPGREHSSECLGCGGP